MRPNKTERNQTKPTQKQTKANIPDETKQNRMKANKLNETKQK